MEMLKLETLSTEGTMVISVDASSRNEVFCYFITGHYNGALIDSSPSPGWLAKLLKEPNLSCYAIPSPATRFAPVDMIFQNIPRGDKTSLLLRLGLA